MTRLQGGRAGIGRASMITGAMLISAAALAGNRFNPPGVTITRNADGSGFVSGTLGGTRNTANTVESLSCTVVRTEVINAAGVPGRSTTVSCIARDKNSLSASCVSTLESHATVLDGVSNDSLIEFRYDANGRCASMTVYESASLERKNP